MSSATAPSVLERIIGRVGLQPQILDTTVNESAFLSLASLVDPWRLVFFDLLTQTDISDIDAENDRRSEQEKRVACLCKWKSKLGAEATYRIIVQSLLKCGYVDKAEDVCQQLLQDSQNQDFLPSSGDSIPDTLTICTVGESSNDVSVVIERLDEQYIEIEQLVFKTIKHRKVPLEDILNWIRFLPTTLRTQFAEIIQEQAKVLSNASNVDELFFILSPYWNFLHPALLEYLVKKLGNKDLKVRMDNYMEDLQHFRIQTTLGDFLDKWVGVIPPGYKEVVLVMGEKWREKTVEDFEKLRIGLSRMQSFGGGRMSFLKTAKSSSILVVVAFSEYLFPINLRLKDIHTFLREEIVLKVIVDGQCVLNLESLVDCEAQLFKRCAEVGSDINEIAFLLSQPGLDPNIYEKGGWTLLWLACYLGRIDLATLLLKNGANVNLPTNDKYGESPLITASAEGNFALCKILLDRGAKVDYQNKDNYTALYLASQHGHKEVVALLLDKGANVDKPNMNLGFTALRIASAAGQTEVVHGLIAKGATVDYQDKNNATPLIVACQEGHLEVAQTLIFSGAAINHQRKEGGAAIHYASANGHSSVVELLVESGAQLDIQTKYGSAALALASRQGHKHTVDILIKAKSNPDIQDQNGLTALMKAANCGHKDVVESLLAGNANPNMTDKETGRSALFIASEQNNLELVELLVKGGAKVDMKDKNDLTPLDIAKIHSHDEVHKLLQKYSSGGEVGKDITEEQKERSKILTKRLRKIFDNLERIFLRGQVLKAEEQRSLRNYPTLSAESAQQQIILQKINY